MGIFRISYSGPKQLFYCRILQIAAINKVLESSKAEPWNYGSSFELPGCSRKGDYDFVAFGIATVALLSDAAEIGLSEKAREKLVKDLLPEYGNPPLEHKTKFKLEASCVEV